jgi:K+ transporter
VPIAIGILVGLFAVQSRGTGVMGALLRPDHGWSGSSPWACLVLIQIAAHPGVFLRR